MEELRIAQDNVAYSLAQFREYYGDAAERVWNQALPVNGSIAAAEKYGITGNDESTSRFKKMLVKYIQKHWSTRRLLKRLELDCGVVNSPGQFSGEVAQELLEKWNLSLVCVFDVSPNAGGPVRCQLFSNGDTNAAEVAELYGGTGSEREATFHVRHLSAFQQLWAAESIAAPS